MANPGSMALELHLTARDMTGTAFTSATAKTKAYSRTTQRELKDMMGAATSYAKLVGSIVSAKVLSRGFAVLEQGIRDVTANIVDMDQALVAASAKFGEGAKKGTEGFQEMKTLVTDISRTTEFTASETAQALDFLGMAGFGHAQAMKSLRPLTDLATAAQMDFARASDIASDALGAFNMSTEPDQIENNLTRINDVFAETVTTSNTTMETLFDTMKLAGPVVKGGVEMFGTLAGTLGSAGIKGTIAATTMKNMFLRLQAPPSEARKALRKLRVEIDDGNGKMVDMITIIGRLNESLAGKNEIQREKFLKDIFGMRAIAGVNVLLRKGEGALRDYHEQLTNSQGAAQDMADTMREGLGVQLKVLESTLMAKGFDIFKGLMGGKDAVASVKELIEVIREYDVAPIVEGLREIGKVAKATASFLWENREMIKSFIKLWIASNIAGKIGRAISTVQSFTGAIMGPGGLNAALGGTSKSVSGLATEIKGFKGGLQQAGPVIASFLAGLAAGHEIWRAIERIQDKLMMDENRNVRLTMGKNIRGEDLSYEEAKNEMSRIQRKWDTSLRDRALSGADEANLLEGRLVTNRIWRMEQEAARRVQRVIEERESAFSEGATLRNRMWGGGGFQAPESSSEFWRGEDFGMSSATMAEKRIEGITLHSMPEIKWSPEQEFKVNVTVNGLPEGATATAEVEQVPTLSDATLGAANG